MDVTAVAELSQLQSNFSVSLSTVVWINIVDPSFLLTFDFQLA